MSVLYYYHCHKFLSNGVLSVFFDTAHLQSCFRTVCRPFSSTSCCPGRPRSLWHFNGLTGITPAPSPLRLARRGRAPFNRTVRREVIITIRVRCPGQCACAVHRKHWLCVRYRFPIPHRPSVDHTARTKQLIGSLTVTSAIMHVIMASYQTRDLSTCACL